MAGKMFPKLRQSKLLRALGPFLIVFIIAAIFSLTTPTFFTLGNFLTLSHSAAIYVILAMGLSCVLISGATDLSAGSVVGLTGITCCLMMRDFGLPVWVGVLVGVGTGVLCGALNGILATKLGLVPFIATLGTQWIYRGLTNILGGGMPVSVRDSAIEGQADQFYWLGGGRVLGVPVPIYIFVIFGVVLSFLLAKTVFGRNLYAVGSNAEAARLSGIKSHKTQIIAYMICDGMAGLAGVILAARLVSGQTNAGQGYEFEGIFASVIGGVSLAGGEGTILGAMIGAFVVAILRNGLNLNGVSSFWQQVILGVIIVIAVYVDVQRVKRQQAKTVAS